LNDNADAQPDRVMQMTTVNYLNRVEASAYLLEHWSLKRSVSYLNQMAAKGSGPKFHKGGRTPLYAPAHLDEWAKDTNRTRSAVEYRAPAFGGGKRPIANRSAINLGLGAILTVRSETVATKIRGLS
jgi:hypothetical protein